MFHAFIAVSAIVPSLLILRYFHVRDRYREPGRVLWATFFLGVLSVLGIVVVLPFAPFIDGVTNPWVRGILSAFLTAAIPEEAVKLAVLLGYCARHKEFDEPIDGMIYGVAASLGFATLENILYVASNGMGVAIMRAFTAVPQHAFTGAILGYYVAAAKFHRKKHAILEGYLIVVLLHGLYDAPLLVLKAMEGKGYTADSSEKVTVGILVVVVSLALVVTDVLWARRLLLRARDEQDGPNTRARKKYEETHAEATTSPVADFLLLGSGGVLATVGGLIAFGMSVGAILESPFNEKVLVGGLIVGLPILGIGIVLFGLGTRRQTARTRARMTLQGAHPGHHPRR